MHTCHNIVQKQGQCIVGAQETHSFRGIAVKKAKIYSFLSSRFEFNNLAKNDFHQKFERLMILQYQKSQIDPFFDFEIFSYI